ncbi:hypothetical protein GCM10009809_28790 [Isoptericola hypogeus]|uniref:Beta-lactamase-related domain-containing protein n=1 Tax=Isoptericola hypogeus TaxID=300179 RepID=A0ABP4VSX3_9MICO
MTTSDPTAIDAGLATLARRAHALDVAVHTVQATVGGEPVATAACAPLGLDVPQRMYSVSKTVTGLAVGLLAAEGKVSLDDPVVRHFPEMAPVHPWLEATTLRHMLAMRGPHRSTTYEVRDGGWLESYFRVPPSHRPGTMFTYDTSASYTLAALVERTAGSSLTEYLRPRVFDPLGMSPGLRFLTGPDGFSHGGSGLVCTPRDLLRLAHLLLDDGVAGGERLLPADYLRAATSPQTDTATATWGAEFRGAYGYQLWLPPRGGWLMFGLGGQVVYGHPGHQLAVVVTADAQAAGSGDTKLLDLVLAHVVDPAVDGPAASRGPAPAHDAVELTWPAPRHDAAHARPLTGRWSGRTADGDPVELALRLDERGGTVSSTAGLVLELSFDGPVRTTVADDPAVITAAWSAPGVLDVRCAGHGDELATTRMRLVAPGDGTLTVQSQGFGETLDPRWTFLATCSPAG